MTLRTNWDFAAVRLFRDELFCPGFDEWGLFGGYAVNGRGDRFNPSQGWISKWTATIDYNIIGRQKNKLRSYTEFMTLPTLHPWPHELCNHDERLHDASPISSHHPSAAAAPHFSLPLPQPPFHACHPRFWHWTRFLYSHSMSLFLQQLSLHRRREHTRLNHHPFLHPITLRRQLRMELIKNLITTTTLR